MTEYDICNSYQRSTMTNDSIYLHLDIALLLNNNKYNENQEFSI